MTLFVILRTSPAFFGDRKIVGIICNELSSVFAHLDDSDVAAVCSSNEEATTDVTLTITASSDESTRLQLQQALATLLPMLKTHEVVFTESTPKVGDVGTAITDATNRAQQLIDGFTRGVFADVSAPPVSNSLDDADASRDYVDIY